ncbi:thiamine-phosphate kinase [Paenibacillus chitinolyticus]|uniref:thiamine-phosphate kinase n=1 Tax=Paenibacillus chitinolyticus TaxID=79263 RepID=UPI003630D283
MQHDEFGLIRLLTGDRQQADGMRSQGVVVGIGDDAAVTALSPGMQLVASCDTMTEGIHFLPVTMRDEDIGFKAMASNISDMAAMGAKARYALVALSLPKDADTEQIRRIYAGLYECADLFGVAVIGGDTTSTRGGIVLTVTILGEVPAGRALLRSGAKPGDAVFVTGPLGGSAAGLSYLLHRGTDAALWGELPAEAAELVRAHTRPLPQAEAGELLQRTGLCRALNDISDGLASEAGEIAEASGVGLLIAEEKLPLAEGLRACAEKLAADPLEWVLYGGEDYQLLGTAAEADLAALCEAFSGEGLPLHVIGRVTAADEGVRLQRPDGTVQPLPKRGYNHFAAK